MTYMETLTQSQRLYLLRLLAKMPEYKANNATLLVAMNQIGLPMSAQKLQFELGWLAEIGLISIERVGTSDSAMLIAELKDAGLDVAAGLSTVQGIARPRPGEAL